MTFQLDTTGHVDMSRTGLIGRFYWFDLSPFTQGYIEAMFASEQYGLFSPGNHGEPPAFSDLAPETLARIIADCKASRHATDPERGSAFWRMRQRGEIEGFPPLTVQLGDDGKVRFAA